MSERIDHTEISELQISLAIREAEDEEATSIVHAMLAQTRATLALVEQQRIANLIAARAQSESPRIDLRGHSQSHAIVQKTTDDEIREALGLS